METKQAADPAQPGNPPAAETPAKDLRLTGEQTNEGTTPLAKGAAPELPHPWMSGLTAEQKADADLTKSLSRFERGIPDLAKAYVELEKKAGRPVVPGETATDEEKAAFRKAIGVPEKPTDYKLEKLEKPPVSGEELAEINKAVTETAHKLGLNNDQANGVRALYLARKAAEAAALAKAKTEAADRAEQTLKERYRAGMDEAIEYRDRARRKFLNPELEKRIRASGLGEDADFVSMLVEVGKTVTEAKFREDRRPQSPTTNPVGQRTTSELANILHPPAEAK